MAHLQDRWRQDPTREGLGKRWRVRWRTPSGATRSRSFERRAEAQLFKASIERDLAVGEYRDPARGKQTVGASAEVWYASHAKRLKASTAVGYRLDDVGVRLDTDARRAVSPTRVVSIVR